MDMNTAANESGTILAQAVIKEIIAQGHSATGTAVDTIQHRISRTANVLNIEIWGMGYLQNINFARKAGTRVPLVVLERWVKIRMIDRAWNIKARSAAYIIQQAIFKEGSPTRGAYQHSRNGKRTGFAEEAIAECEVEIERILTQSLSDDLDLALHAA